MSNRNSDDGLFLSPAERRRTITRPRSVLNSDLVSTKDGQHMLEAVGKSELALELGAHKTAYAISKAADVEDHAVREYAAVTVSMDASVEAVRNTPSADQVKGFANYSSAQLRGVIADMVNVHAERALDEVARSVPQKAPKGRFGR